jgi:hypothetical protein
MQGVRSTKLPAISPEKESELVMSYGPNLKEAMRRTARYVDKIRFVTARAILFSIVLGVSAISTARAAPGGLARIGVLNPQGAPASTENGFREALKELGYVEGMDVLIEWR